MRLRSESDHKTETREFNTKKKEKKKHGPWERGGEGRRAIPNLKLVTSCFLEGKRGKGGEGRRGHHHAGQNDYLLNSEE